MSNAKNQNLEVISVIVLFLAILAFMIVGFSVDWMPPVASEHGVGVDRVINYLFLTTGTLIVIGTVVLVVFLWKYGRGQPVDSPSTSQRTERLWSIVPVIIMALIAETGVIIIGMPVWEQVYGETAENALIIDVVGRQFEWVVRYSGDDETFGRTDPNLVDDDVGNPLGLDMEDPAAADDIFFRGEMHVPTGRMVYLRLRAQDVLHSFSVPALRVKQDLVPGLIGSTQFVATVPGEYEIACAELCGMGHYKMSGVIIVHEPAAFEDWLEQQRDAAL